MNSRSSRDRMWGLFGFDAPSTVSEAPKAARASFLDTAIDYATAGQYDDAVLEFRRASVLDADRDRALLEYGRYLIERSNSAAAEEVLAAALWHNGANVDALELYLEVVRERELPASHQTWAFTALVHALAEHPGGHRGSLDYVIANRLEDSYETLLHSPDAVSRAAIAINDSYIAHSFGDDALASATQELPPHEAHRAHVIVLLGRGKASAAANLLSTMDSNSIPMNSLRRAIRRALAMDRTKQARAYLEIYLKQRPKDAWARTKLRGLNDQEFSNYILGKKGFPLPPIRGVSAYDPVSNRVLYLLHNSLPYNSAGYATRTHGLLRELNKGGWDVDGVTRLGYPYDMPGKADLPDVAPRDQIDEVDYLRLLEGREIEKKNPLYFYVQRYSKALLETARTEKPAIIHAASNHWNGLTAVNTARQLGLPSIYEVRGLWEVTRGSRNPEWAQGNMFKYMARMESDAARAATKVFTITNALRDEMISRGVDEEKITVLPNGVDTQRFTPIPRDEELAQQLGLQGKTVVGYVGSILDYEGLELLIEAAGHLANVRDDFHVLFVGDGAELEKFRELTQDNGLEGVITFTGRVPFEDVERYYSLIDITPFPRLPLPVCEMVSPLKPFEAMAMGKAVIASDVAALAEIVTPGLNGFLHEKGDAESLRHNLERLLEDRDLTRRIGEQARTWVVEHRDWQQIARVVNETYSELTAQLRQEATR